MRQFIVMLLLWSLHSSPISANDDIHLVSEDGEMSESVLEAFLAPGEFPDRRIVHTIGGDEALYSLDIGLGAEKPFVIFHPERVVWPAVADLDLNVGTAERSLEIVSKKATDARLDAGFEVRVALKPLGQRFMPLPHFAAKIVEIEVVAEDNGERLLYYAANRDAPLCGTPRDPGTPRCSVAGIGLETRAISLSPDGRRLAMAFGGLRPRLEVWGIERAPRRIWQALLPKNSGGAVETGFSSDGRFVVVLTGRGQMHRFDADTGGRHLTIPSAGRSACAVPPGRLMAVAGDSGEVKLWYLEDGTIAWRLPPRGTRGAVDRIAASGDGNRIALLEYTDTQTVVRVFAIHRRTMLRQLEIDTLSISDIALDDAGDTLFLSHESRGLLSTTVTGGTAPMGIPTETARECTGRLAWNTKKRLLSCATKIGIKNLDDKGQLHGNFYTTKEKADWIVAIAREGARIAAVGGGRLLVW